MTLGLLLAAKLVRKEPDRAFGEAMMFVYYGCLFPLSTRIARGFYGDGVWSDSGFMRWAQISAVSWKEERDVTLILISHFRNIARRLDVPGDLYGQARRVLRRRFASTPFGSEAPAWISGLGPRTTPSKEKRVQNR